MVSPIDIGGKIFDIFSGLDSKQKCIVEVTNDTGHTLKRISDEHSSGGFATLPEDEIPPGGKDAFISHDTGILRGADGKVTYGVFPEGADAAIGKWTIHWDIPQVGTPSSEALLDGLDAGKFQSSHRIGDGDETEAKFELKSEHAKKDDKKDDKKDPKPATGEFKSTVLITVRNNTDQTLVLLDQGHDHGGFVNLPAQEIKPHESNSFSSAETDRGKPGSKGFLKYGVGGGETCVWTIGWDNPESADNTSESTVDGVDAHLYTGLDQIGAGEENVPATFTITKHAGGGGGGTKPPAKSTDNTLEIKIVNNSTQNLTLVDSGAFTGEIASQPFDEITAGGMITFASAETRENGATGCSGYVRYRAGETLWTLLWDNPEHGENTASQNLEGGHAESFQGAAEVTQDKEKGKATFTLTGGHDHTQDPDYEPPVESSEPTLRLGDQSRDGWVEYLQMQLNSLGYGPLPTDGNFNEAVLAQVRAFQTDRHLKVDGVVGNQTWAALRDETPRPPSTDGRTPHTYVEQGAEARFFTEAAAFDYVPGGDQLLITAANTGSQTIMPYQFELTARLTFPDGEQHTFTVPLTNQGQPSQPGELCYFEGGMGVQLTPGTYYFEAYMPAELGGDQTGGELVIPEQ